MTTINVTQYGSPHPADRRVRYFLSAEQGKETAAAVKFKDAILAGPVNIEIRASMERGHCWSGTTPTIKEGWMKGFFGPTAREVGIDLVFKNLSNLLASCNVAIVGSVTLCKMLAEHNP